MGAQSLVPWETFIAYFQRPYYKHLLPSEKLSDAVWQ